MNNGAAQVAAETAQTVSPVPEMSTLIFPKPLSWQDRMTIEVLLDRYRDDESLFAKIESDDRVTLIIPKVIRRISWES